MPMVFLLNGTIVGNSTTQSPARTRDGAEEYAKMLTQHLTRIVALCQEHYDFIQAPKWTLTTLKSGHLENWQDFFHM